MSMRKYMILGAISACVPIPIVASSFFSVGLSVAMGVALKCQYDFYKYNPYKIVIGTVNASNNNTNLHVVENNIKILSPESVRKISWEKGDGKRAINDFAGNLALIHSLRFSDADKHELINRLTEYLQGKISSLDHRIGDIQNSKQFTPSQPAP